MEDFKRGFYFVCLFPRLGAGGFTLVVCCVLFYNQSGIPLLLDICRDRQQTVKWLKYEVVQNIPRYYKMFSSYWLIETPCVAVVQLKFMVNIINTNNYRTPNSVTKNKNKKLKWTNNSHYRLATKGCLLKCTLQW